MGWLHDIHNILLAFFQRIVALRLPALIDVIFVADGFLMVDVLVEPVDGFTVVFE